ncbi:hypothetical protein [Streptomyces xinghaiensis]|uniref:hypothetical protein n=1 Tax=Streptomyces xinghaiensis TaxID=1038928 RepID=UPI000585344A|nr:hypothetical protein [Streptomyces xinghaiensis]MZE75791.1 radical SAM protein [Streptomyces sp. SID5475]
MSDLAPPRRPLPILDRAEIDGMHPKIADPIEYRKSGLSLNWIVGCPLDCTYCIRQLLDNYDMKVPRRLMSDQDAARALVEHRYFTDHVTPIQLLNKATDPMLPAVKPHLFAVMRHLDDMGLTNMVLVITRWRVTPEDCAVLNSFKNLRVTVLVTHSGIADKRIEPVDSHIAAASLRTLYEHADRYRTILYWRPIVPGLNDTPDDFQRARELAEHAHATVFTGLFFRDEITDFYKAHNLPMPYEETARRKIMPETLERRILDFFRRPDTQAPFGELFRKTSCAVTFAHGEPDYNGHYGIRELCSICPRAQLELCARAFTKPNPKHVIQDARRLGATGEVTITDRAITVQGLDEPPRYYLQHTYGYQCHAAEHPHLPRQHGRAPIGWRAEDGART